MSSFLYLLFSFCFLWAFGKIFKAINGAAENREKKKAEAERAAQQTSKPVHTASVIPSPSEPEEELYEDEDDDEIIAVIAAAIAAYGAAEGKQYRIASIKRPRSARSGWSAAGIAENMRGFMN